jgi:hypothetical protein
MALSTRVHWVLGRRLVFRLLEHIKESGVVEPVPRARVARFSPP